MGRKFEDVGIMRVSRQGQRQGDREPGALRLVFGYVSLVFRLVQ